MKIKTLLCGIGIMALSSCAGEKAKKLDVDKALVYCDVQVHRALAELEKTGRRIIVCSLEISCQVKSSGIAERWLRKNGLGDSGRVFCGMIMKLHKMIRFVCWLKSIQNR